MAPEVVGSDESIGVYSLGVVLTELDTHRILSRPKRFLVADESCLRWFVELAHACTARYSKRRPTARHVAAQLDDHNQVLP
ncbi:hypothetical protein SDRG_04537 [Saprolegnia diclina VS20]|uniref:Protein kinase domain-containing protein n=1 Tax=Saprolegnia diclina (strain VS20) TaxID=1156394 RepID=T0S5X6_SAPDV|nr:hypothetical protein SDRG_04537 [Saprolegnia diclina VS20]EQC38107.1 hypothetical protein SDRG_04537 [Saprolegnia diclina VS20]|eukprot:XP_008608434.1 hypothetical protein SDRG_04537 [Saprolegnia diclina VS20]